MSVRSLKPKRGECTAHLERVLLPGDAATKYREAAQVANTVLQAIVAGQIVAGAKVFDICKLADDGVARLVSQLYKSKKTIEKGLAFPTCVNVNNCVAHFSPLESESAVVLADGDVVKIQLGVHIDGYAAMASHTAVVGASDARPVIGPAADVIAAAYAAAQVAARLVKPGNTNAQVTDAIRRVADAYGVTPLAGVLSHDLKRFVVDGDKVILGREDPETKVEEVRALTPPVPPLRCEEGSVSASAHGMPRSTADHL